MKNKLIKEIEWYVDRYNNDMCIERLKDLEDYCDCAFNTFYDLYHRLGLISEKIYKDCEWVLTHFNNEIIVSKIKGCNHTISKEVF